MKNPPRRAPADFTDMHGDLDYDDATDLDSYPFQTPVVHIILLAVSISFAGGMLFVGMDQFSFREYFTVGFIAFFSLVNVGTARMARQKALGPENRARRLYLSFVRGTTAPRKGPICVDMKTAPIPGTHGSLGTSYEYRIRLPSPQPDDSLQKWSKNRFEIVQANDMNPGARELPHGVEKIRLASLVNARASDGNGGSRVP